MIRTNPRENYQRSFQRLWPHRNEPPAMLPNARAPVNVRGCLRDNIRAQRQTLAYHRTLVADEFLAYHPAP